MDECVKAGRALVIYVIVGFGRIDPLLQEDADSE